MPFAIATAEDGFVHLLREEPAEEEEEEDEEETAAAAAAGMKVKVVLKRAEMEWLMAQLKTGDRRLAGHRIRPVSFVGTNHGSSTLQAERDRIYKEDEYRVFFVTYAAWCGRFSAKVHPTGERVDGSLSWTFRLDATVEISISKFATFGAFSQDMASLRGQCDDIANNIEMMTMKPITNFPLT
uniref:Uncharacterized protein n=1 Tax=Oryza meridionalis TaxID=40149 RepID=A0A0E0DB83_9ORYZ